MVWWIKPLELADSQGQGTGKWRLTATSDEGGGGPHGLCEHEHDSPEEAQNCPEARDFADMLTGGRAQAEKN